jgi:hypothetical protein
VNAPRMKLSAFITGLQALLDEHGDHDVMYEYGTHASLPYFCDCDDPSGEDPRYLLEFEEI